MAHFRLLALLGCALSWLCAETSARYPIPPESFRNADAIGHARAVVTELLAAKKIPGFSIAVGRNGTIIWSEGFGLADVEKGVLVTPLTRFRLGSVSKVLTAAGIARLVEDHKLDLDAPVQQYVPTFPAKQWPITTRQLAGHMAGIRHYANDFSGPLKGSPHFESVARGLSIFANDPLLFEPGTQYAYSSYGWNLISAVIEAAAGEEFLAYMQRAIFEPLGVRNLAADHVDRIISNRTSFYSRSQEGVLKNAAYTDNSYKWAGGGFLGSAEDLVRFGSAHLQPGFFSQATLDVLFTSQTLSSGKPTGVGIAWRIGVDGNGRRILHHGGSLDGGRAMLMMFPESGVVVAMLSNMYVDFGEKDAIRIGELFIK
jgi:serine beta-lactamase-like protein LACTB, mitochondrial